MFLSQMNEAMQNPAVIEAMQNSPAMRDNPMARQMLQNPEFRRMLTDPNIIRAQLQLRRSMGGMEGGGASAFPAPGETNTTPQTGASGEDTNAGLGGQGAAPNPFAQFAGQGAGGAAGANPFAALFGANPASGTPPTSPPPPGSTGQGGQGQDQANPFAGLLAGMQGQGQGAGGNGSGAGASPFAQMTQNMMQNPEAMRSILQMMGGGAGDAGGMGNPFGGMGGMGGMGGEGGFGGGQPAAPADNRPPEERYAEQLRQLNDMGFYEFERNVQALRRSGGSVQGAVEHLLSGL